MKSDREIEPVPGNNSLLIVDKLNGEGREEEEEEEEEEGKAEAASSVAVRLCNWFGGIEDKVQWAS